MRTTIITIIASLICLEVSAQQYKGISTTSLYKKYDKICYKRDIIRSTDSLLKIAPYDTWFYNLSAADKSFRIKRITFYNNLCKRKPTQKKFLKGWVRRAIS